MDSVVQMLEPAGPNAALCVSSLDLARGRVHKSLLSSVCFEVRPSTRFCLRRWGWGSSEEDLQRAQLPQRRGKLPQLPARERQQPRQGQVE